MDGLSVSNNWFVRRVPEAAIVSDWWGLAWLEHTSMHIVIMPIPFNVIARIFRTWWLRLRLPQGKDLLEECWRDGDRHGFERGYKQGRETGLMLTKTLLEVREELQALHREVAS